MQNRGGGLYSAQLSAKLLDRLETYFEIEYHYPKMDKISLPDFASGAMENWVSALCASGYV